MPETKPTAAAVETTSNNNGTTATKPDDTKPSSETTTPPPKEKVSLSKGWFKKLIPVVVLALAAFILFGISGGWSRWVGSGSQTTDDAILRADITPLSTRVSGTVMQVAVADYQRVKAGDLLVQLKDDDFKAQVAQAEAAVAAAQADAERTSLERKRQEALVDLGAATKQKLEQVVADQERFAAIVDSRKAELTQTRALVESRRAEFSKARAQVSLREAEQQRARAQMMSRSAEVDAQIKQRSVLDAQEQQLQADLSAKKEALKVAQTNLDYTRILAPTDGIVGERKVRVGQLVSPGTQVLSLVENTIWVQANYKETQLTNVTRGDAAEITIDTFPGVVLKGHVEEIAPASGSQFALLPP